MRRLLTVQLCLLCLTVASFGSDTKTDSEAVTLKVRIAQLEEQNRQMQEMLGTLKAQLQQLEERVAAPGICQSDLPAPVEGPPDMSAQATLAKPDTLGDGSGAVPPPADPPVDTVVPTSDHVLWPELLGGDDRLRLYGFLRVDLDMDSQRPNNGQTILFVTSPDLPNNDQGNFTIHPRLTRLGLDFHGTSVEGLGDALLSGKLEADFENGGSESRQIPRIRHAYFRLDWKHAALLGGQTWDAFSPLYPSVNSDDLMWWAGNLGDRRPQLRAELTPSWESSRLAITAGIGLNGAINLQDLDQNGYRDGEESSRPALEGRIGYSHSSWADGQKLSFGLSGYYGWFSPSQPVQGRRDFHIQAVNVDFRLPLVNRLQLQGEGWWGRNLADVRGGIGQGINLTTGREIRSRGGWSELVLQVLPKWSIHPGISTDDPLDIDVPEGGRTRNAAFYVGNRFRPGGGFLIGFDYLYWKTQFKGLSPGIDNRINAFFQFGF